MKLNRRGLLAGAAAVPLGSTLASNALADGHAKAAISPNARSFRIGDFTVTTLLDGSLPRDGVKEIFGGGASDEDFSRVSAENFISADMAQFYFTPTLVDTGSEKVLFDTGLGQGGIQKALAEVGVTPDQIDIVVLTHMHPDHIGGMTTSNTATFPNARYVTARAEYDGWLALGSDNRIAKLMASKVVPFAEQITFVEDGQDVVSGITATAAFGHTPGHMTYMLDNGGSQLLLTADLANHYVWTFAHPEWEVSFDMDKSAAAQSRRRILDMLATTRTPMIGYHMPFPAAGYVETRGSGFRFVPVGYQLMG